MHVPMPEGESSEQTRCRENAEHQQGRAYADQGCAVGVRANRVNLPAAREATENRAGRNEHRERDQDDGRDAEDAGASYVKPRLRHLIGADLSAASPETDKAAKYRKRSQGHDDGGDAAKRHDEPIQKPAADSDQARDSNAHENGARRMIVHKGRRTIGGETDDRCDGQIDVAGQHHQHLPDRHDH
jgi:hypothetical protein